MDDRERQGIELDCERLIARYAYLVDEARWEEVGALYRPDGLMTRPSAPDVAIVGRDAILAAFRDRPARYSRHLCTNIVVEVESATRAHARSRILLFTATPDDPAATVSGVLPRLAGLPLVGEYDDVLVRGAEGWLFAERRGRLAFRS